MLLNPLRHLGWRNGAIVLNYLECEMYQGLTVSEKATHLICKMFPVIALWNQSGVALFMRPLRDSVTP
jgi:hypothetical protein